MHLNYKIKFDGKDADKHRLEAYPAAHTLEGLSWSLSIVFHYGITGTIRERGNLSSSAKIYISPPKRGSVIYDLNVFVVENPFLVATVGAYTINTVTPYLNGLIKYTFNQAMGAGGEFARGAKRYLRRLDENELEKLTVRIEPPLTRAHTAIGKTANTIAFKSKRTDIAVLNASSKAFLEAKLTDQFETIETNVTSFNVLTGNGRLYDPDTEGTVAFSISSNPLGGTKSVLIASMEQFALGRQGYIRIVAQRVETVDHRLKKYLISAAEEIPQEDWEDGIDPMRVRRS